MPNENIFAELQMLTLEDSPIPEFRKELNELTEFMQSLPVQDENFPGMAHLRQLKISTLKAAGGFMVPDDLPVLALPEKFQNQKYGFVYGAHITMAGRFTFPVKDVHGDVAGFVGYDKYTKPKYLDSRNYGYLAKSSMVFGMENLPQYYKDGYCIFVEGSMCKLWLNENGFNSCALLGSYVSPYMGEIMKRFRRRCIVIPDADEAGDHFKMQAQRLAPEARIVQSLVAKDVDDSRKVADIIPDIRGLISNPFYTATNFR